MVDSEECFLVTVRGESSGSSSTSTSSGEGYASIISLSGGARKKQLRGGGALGAPRHGIALLGSERAVAIARGAGGESRSWPIFCWEYGGGGVKEQPRVRSFPAERMEALCGAAGGALLLAGSKGGNIMAWDCTTGQLLKVWTAHYRPVTCLRLSPDGSLLLSGGEDGVCHVWNLVSALAGGHGKEIKALGQSSTRPLYSWAKHTLPITDIICGVRGAGGGGLAVTSSLDCKVMMWSLAQGTLLKSVAFSSPVNTIALDPVEVRLYAGCSDGVIRTIGLRPGIPDGETNAHKAKITSLACSSDGSTVVSGSDDGDIHLWDTSSLQILHSISFKAPITNVMMLSSKQSMIASGVGEREPSCPPVPLAKYAQSQSSRLQPWETTFIPLKRSREGRELSFKGNTSCLDILEDFVQRGKKRKKVSRRIKPEAEPNLMNEAEYHRVLEENARLKVALDSATDSSKKWQAMHDELKTFCVGHFTNPTSKKK